MIVCTRCHTPLTPEHVGVATPLPCAGCHAGVQVEAFPALLRPLGAGRASHDVVSTEEASCFYHAQKRAAVPCDDCGRFLCSLCDLEIDGRHVCPRCLENRYSGGTDERLVRERTLYDSMALSLALLPLLIFYFTVITAPITLYLCIRHWSSPVSLLPRTKIRFILAFLIAGLELAGWLLLLGFFVFAIVRA
jgi:hypothetical protein